MGKLIVSTAIFHSYDKIPESSWNSSDFMLFNMVLWDLRWIPLRNLTVCYGQWAVNRLFMSRVNSWKTDGRGRFLLGCESLRMRSTLHSCGIAFSVSSESCPSKSLELSAPFSTYHPTENVVQDHVQNTSWHITTLPKHPDMISHASKYQHWGPDIYELICVFNTSAS